MRAMSLLRLLKPKFIKNRIRKMFRDLCIKNLKIFGSNFADRLERLSYSIKNSLYYSSLIATIELPNRNSMYEYIINSEKLIKKDIIYLEFGVSEGKSFKWWVTHNKGKNSKFIGFDCFYGLPENWDTFPKGSFPTEGKIPTINDSRVSFQKGLFQNTLEPFIKENYSSIRLYNKIIHMDADLFSSTSYVLLLLNSYSYIRNGDILIFDDFFSLRSANTAFRAFLDYCKITQIAFNPIAKTLREFSIKID